MNEDILTTYQKYINLSASTNEKNSEADLLKSSFYKRYATYLAYQHSISFCDNQTTCLILDKKLKEYSAMIDNRKGINNFASVAKSLANNVTNVSKKWTSGLENSLPDLSVNKLLKCNQGDGCENLSNEGCTSGIPTQQYVDHFFTTLAKLNQEDRSKYPSAQPYSPKTNRCAVENKQISLYSTYEDSYLDQMRSETNSKLQNKLVQQKINLKSNENSTASKGWVKDDKSSSKETFPAKRFNLPDNSAVKRYNQPDNFVNRRDKKNSVDTDENGVTRRFTNAERIKKLSKFLKEDEQDERKQLDFFKTASETLKVQNQMRHGGSYNPYGSYNSTTGGVKKTLGGKGRMASNKFVPPLRPSQEEDSDMLITRSVLGRPGPSSSNGAHSMEPVDERLSHIDPKMVELIKSEIMDHGASITWDDIAGLDFAKHTIQEIVVWPMLRPDIFTGLRQPPKGILLFGPPGTGKTLIGKCIASQSKSTFFSISASSLTSKWIGDGEKMVRALFAVARVEQPSVVFIDEIDSLLSQRSDQEHESSRRIKTEFLVQLDGAATGDEDRLLIIGATNRPQELDEAARRRLVKRLYIPLPDFKARKQLVNNLMSKERNDLSEADLDEVAQLTDGYSGADMKNLCQEASLGPIRALSASLIAHINPDQVRPVNIEDFKQALKRVRSSVSNKDLELYIEWDKQFGMSS